VLVLGAISGEGGASAEVEPHLPSLIPLLFNFLSDGHVRMKITATWTLSIFSYWIVENTEKDLQIYVEKL